MLYELVIDNFKSNFMLKRCAIVLIAILSLCSCSKKNDVVIVSPDTELAIYYTQNESGFISARLDIQDTTVLIFPKFGFHSRDSVNLYSQFSIDSVVYGSVDSVWYQKWGQNKQVLEKYNSALVYYHNLDCKLCIETRVFNEGIAYRYQVSTLKDSLNITDELSSIQFVSNAVSWTIPANFDTYELEYRKLPLDSLMSFNTPALFHLKSNYFLSLHEAALTDYPEMTYKRVEPSLYEVNLAPWPDGDKIKSEGIFTSPWRTYNIGKKSVDIINSNMILNLNEPSVIENDSWINPIKYVGIWWGMHLGVQTWYMGVRHGATTSHMKKYIDFAANNDIDAVLAEGWNQGWENWGTNQSFDFSKSYDDFDLNEILNYSNKMNIAFISHHETGGNIANYENQLESSMSALKQKGVHYLKTGYAGGFPKGQNHHGQYAVRHFRSVVETAAKYKICIDAHEAIKPTGIRRTFPNMMTRECARGMEWNAWSSGNTPFHHEILPFTRLLGGPMDYTPGTFDILFESTRNSKDRKKWNGLDQGDSRVNTTLAKQLANWIILYSPMQMASDMIENYANHPAFDFFKALDVDFDESKALDGYPGEFIVMMRRSKDTYYLAATTNQDSRKCMVALDFLPKNTAYQATIYADGKTAHWKSNPLDYSISKKIVHSRTLMNMQLAAGGGQVIILNKLDK